MRSGNWKIVSLHPEAWELYDIAADRVGHNKAQHPDIVKRLSDEWDAWAKRPAAPAWSVRSPGCVNLHH